MIFYTINMPTNLLVEQELFFLPEHQSSSPVLSEVLVAQSVLCVVYCNSFLVLLYFLIWSLYCLSLDLRLLITPLVSSNLSTLFVLFPFLCWPLHCLPFLNLRLLITPLVSSNFSYPCKTTYF